ncbi:putative alpha,alpha-trehalose-phosphate synthase [UDP-forming] 7 [Bidens hawaiensis]|uniref:putative alpha,alpha-trehalose-phosphate synthase [UDP-forming] 7 n=1 Tax=Bidens hawaiensis TaxID=980011 RepID=UPI004048EFD2
MSTASLFPEYYQDLIDASDAPSDARNRLIVVSNQLPIIATHKPTENEGYLWEFVWDESSIYMHIKDSVPNNIEVFYVGTLRADVDPTEQDDVAKALLDNFNCVTVFVLPEQWDQYYNLFCKQYLWPRFHYKLPASDFHNVPYSRDLRKAYVHVNMEFSRKVIETVTNNGNYIWIHDYHLMALPTILRRKFCGYKIGFFLHSPFPASEVFKTLPMRNEILNGLLHADLIGFHTYDYARHFLSCCSRMFGLDTQLKRGGVFLEYNGRNIEIKIKPSGIHVGRMELRLDQPDTRVMVEDLKIRFAGKVVLIGVDDSDIFKGVNFKILAMEEMLKRYPDLVGFVVLLQILNPLRGRGNDVDDINAELTSVCERVNNKFRRQEYEPIVLITRPVLLHERVAYYAISDAAIVTPLRDGMNLIPYEYVVSRQCGDVNNSAKKSMLVVSEFMGCSPSLSGAIRVNPWDVSATAEAMFTAISTCDNHKETIHRNHYQYITTHDVLNWARGFFEDLEKTCVDHSHKRGMNLGIGLDTRVVLFDKKFSELDVNILENAYNMAQNRAILLDCDGTITSRIDKIPTESVISMINKLCSDPKNTVCVISGRGQDKLGKWFGECDKLVIAAEHGYFIRWADNQDWEPCGRTNNVGWMEIAEPVMKQYTEATDGSSIEKKETAMVWHYEDADKSFGSHQAKELLDHLESVLTNEPVAVRRGLYIVEVKPQGVTKGMVAEKIFAFMAEKGNRADFVLSIGDDRSDEDMFLEIGEGIKKGEISNDNSVFTCTVGVKPSAAAYYLDEVKDVLEMLEKLGRVSNGE